MSDNGFVEVKEFAKANDFSVNRLKTQYRKAIRKVGRKSMIDTNEFFNILKKQDSPSKKNTASKGKTIIAKGEPVIAKGEGFIAKGEGINSKTV